MQTTPWISCILSSTPKYNIHLEFYPSIATLHSVQLPLQPLTNSMSPWKHVLMIMRIRIKQKIWNFECRRNISSCFLTLNYWITRISLNLFPFEGRINSFWWMRLFDFSFPGCGKSNTMRECFLFGLDSFPRNLMFYFIKTLIYIFLYFVSNFFD